MSDVAPPSVFHPGEHAVQTRAGVRERVERMGQRMIRDHLIDQHREFYALLPQLFVGHDDARGQPWASVLTGAPGFVHSPDPHHLRIDASPHPDDPLAAAWEPGQRLGVLGLQFETRRRNRLSGRVRELDPGGVTLDVDQSFGNCPKYIQTRSRSPLAPGSPPAPAQRLEAFDDRATALISTADTFFVASGTRRDDQQPGDGVDVSHRGGPPGFVLIENERQLLVPDYRGNNAYNTLGNFAANPGAGLLFIDFATGDLLTTTGTAEILWEVPEPARDALPGAQRAWRFTLEHGHWLPDGLGQRWALESPSPTNPTLPPPAATSE